MATFLGLKLCATQTIKTDDKYSILRGSLYLGDNKLATVELEKNKDGETTAAQLFMMYGYSEKALREQLAAAEMDVEGLVSRLQWLGEVEKKYHENSATASGVACLQHVQSNITMGIPSRLGSATDEEVLGELQYFIDKNEKLYGTCLGYAIFRRAEDFNQGQPIAPESLQG